MANKTAVIIGVGPIEGLGAQLCIHAAREGLHVVIAGRTETKLHAVADVIANEKGEATPVVTDVTDEDGVVSLVQQAETIGPIGLAVYNAGNNYNGNFLDLEADFFERAWRVCTFGGFLFARETLKAMVTRSGGTLLFTGASASMRGKPNFAPFTMAKAGLRAMAQSLAREFQPKGIHVGHVVIDGGINGEKIKSNVPDLAARVGEDGLIGLEGIASAYMYLYNQPKNAWTHELDLRTYKETF